VDIEGAPLQRLHELLKAPPNELMDLPNQKKSRKAARLAKFFEKKKHRFDLNCRSNPDWFAVSLFWFKLNFVLARSRLCLAVTDANLARNLNPRWNAHLQQLQIQ
jgi:hypothetical protein